MNINATGYIHSYPLAATTKRANPLNPPDKTGAPSTPEEKKPTTSTGISANGKTWLSTSVDKEPSAVQKEATLVMRDPSLPDEAYAIPSWQVGLHMGIHYISGPDGEMKLLSEDTKFLQAPISEQAEYSELLQKHIQNLYAKNGLSNASDRYHALKSVPGLNEKLRDEFKANLASDARMTALMEKLGASIA